MIRQSKSPRNSLTNSTCGEIAFISPVMLGVPALIQEEKAGNSLNIWYKTTPMPKMSTHMLYRLNAAKAEMIATAV